MKFCKTIAKLRRFHRPRVKAADRAFTLIELLVVIAVTTLLLAILMPVLMKAKTLAMRVKCTHNLKQINLAVVFYLEAHEDTYPCADDPVSTDPFYCLWMGRGWRGFLEPYLGGNIDANNPSVLFCPQDRTAKEKFESTSYAYSMAFYHSPQQIDGMDDRSYTYSNFVPSVPQKSFNVAHPSAKIMIGEWQSYHLPIDNDGGWWDWRGSRNYLFADGSVLFLRAEQIRAANDGLPDGNLTKHGIKGIDYQP